MEIILTAFGILMAGTGGFALSAWIGVGRGKPSRSQKVIEGETVSKTSGEIEQKADKGALSKKGKKNQNEAIQHSESFCANGEKLNKVLEFYGKKARELEKTIADAYRYGVGALDDVETYEEKLREWRDKYSIIVTDSNEGVNNINKIFNTVKLSEFMAYDEKYSSIIGKLADMLSENIYYELKENPENWDDAEAKIAAIDKFVKSFYNMTVEDMQTINEQKFDNLKLNIGEDEESINESVEKEPDYGSKEWIDRELALVSILAQQAKAKALNKAAISG